MTDTELGLRAENWCIMPRAGRQCYLAIDAGPIFDEDGMLIAVVETLRDITQQKEAQMALQRLATKDGLTGIANRRCFDEALAAEWHRAQRDQTSLSLILIDVDHFKRYNDTYGHQKGDDCLKSVARAMEEKIFRPADLVARYGGEEFVILMPNTDVTGARLVAERIVQHVYALAIPHEASDLGETVSISAGVAASVPTPNLGADRLLAAADAALYAAKHAGRNRMSSKDVEPAEA
jgi:diguanylate cyclase (GGDEF)-like protein